MLLKLWKDIILKKNDLSLDGEQLNIQALVAAGDTTEFTQPKLFTVGTGADGPAIPRPMLKEMGLDHLEPSAEKAVELADGSTTTCPIIEVSYRLICEKDTTKYVLLNVPTLVTEEGSEALMGLSVLGFYTYLVNNNKITVLEPNEELFDQLEDIKFKKNVISAIPNKAPEKPKPMGYDQAKPPQVKDNPRGWNKPIPPAAPVKPK